MAIALEKVRQNKKIPGIILWNLAPYWGVFVFHWQPVSVFVCYALETLVIGVFNVFKLIAVYWYGAPEDEGFGPGDMGGFAIPAFAMSYGALAYFQLVVFMAFAGFVREDAAENSLLYSLHLALSNDTMYIVLSLFVVNNAWFFVSDFILNQKYTTVTMNQQMAEPLPHVFISQAVVFLTLWFYSTSGYGMIALTVLTTTKILFEIYLSRQSAAGFLGWE